MMDTPHLTERDLIRLIRDRYPGHGNNLQRGIGDDCAVFRAEEGKLTLVTTDILTAGGHFNLAWHPPYLLGRKAATVNISDIAAMGGVPRFALLSAALPDSTKKDWLDLFLDGFETVLKAYEVELIGGDTVKCASGPLFSITITGEAAEGRVAYRSGARINDLVWTGGHLGNAAAGLECCRQGLMNEEGPWQPFIKAHLDPEAQVDLGILLAGSGMAHAMMDISDGLATDLAHICEESGVGAELTGTDIPYSEGIMETAARLGCSPLDWALQGGEDYCLLFTTDPSCARDLPRMVREKTGREIFCVGRIVTGAGVVLEQDGRREEISFQGYDHFRRA